MSSTLHSTTLHSTSCVYSTPNENEYILMGSGIPSFSPLVDIPDERYLFSCSSMCSAASTAVASAICSMQESLSFPCSSETTFDLARHLKLRLCDDEESRKRKQDPERGWRRCGRNNPSERYHLDGFGCIGNTNLIHEISLIEFAKPRSCCGVPRPEPFHPENRQSAALEEFSLGSGDPYAACDF
jgi:hypothetical protein